MVMFSNYLKKLLKCSRIMFKSSSTSVEKSPSDPQPSSSSFVSCDNLYTSDHVEMSWVSVEQPACSNIAHDQSTDSFPISYQCDRSVSSSSFQFSITVEETETDWVVLDLATSILNSPSPVSSSMVDHSESSNQAAFNSSSLSLSLSSPQISPISTLPPLCSSSDHPSTSCPSNHDIVHSTSSASYATAASFSSSSSISSSSYHIDDSISTAHPLSSFSSSLSSSSSTSNHAPTLSSPQSLSSTISNSASTKKHASRIPSSHTIFIMHTSFKWNEILLAISFTVPVGLLSTTFERHKGILVPAKLFTSNPNLFLIFITLDALAFTASVIGILLQALGKKRNKNCLSYLSLFAFTALVFAFSIYLSVLLPNFLGFISWTLLIIILLVLLYVGVTMYNRNCCKNHSVKSTTLVATTATIV